MKRAGNIAPLVIFLLAVGRASPWAPEEATPDDFDESYFVDKRYKVEFIEDVSKQTYVNSITFEDRFVLDLYLFDQNIKNEKFQLEGEYFRTCPRAIFKSLGLTGLSNPALRTDGVDICPNMQANCCTNNDLIGLDAIWKDYSSFVKLNYDYFSYYAKTTIRAMPQVVAQADVLRNSTAHMICRQAADTFSKFRADEINVEKFLTQLGKVKDFDLAVKRGFKCLLCDHNNNQYFDLQNRVVHYKSEFCVDIVKNTIGFYTNLKDFFLRYFNSAAMVAKCSKSHGEDLERIYPFSLDEPVDFLELRASYYDSECLRAYIAKNDANIAAYCQNYCHRFDLWNLAGILPNTAKMGRMFKLIQENLLEVQEVEVVLPKEEVTQYQFPFVNTLDNVFTEFDQMFGVAGVDPRNVREES